MERNGFKERVLFFVFWILVIEDGSYILGLGVIVFLFVFFVVIFFCVLVGGFLGNKEKEIWGKKKVLEEIVFLRKINWV